MNGKHSIRGYLFQSLIAMLSSLDNDWAEISLEPETTLDKTDIIWTDLKGNKIVCQVKSSINNFTKSQILDWLLKLKDDNPNATEYRVDLVGTTEASVKRFFNQLSKSKKDFGDKESLHSIRDKIKVKFYPFEYSTMLGASISLIDKFLSLKSINVNYSTKELIAGGMVHQLIYFSTNGENLTREKFETKIVEWIHFNYSEQFISDKTNFKLFFYYKNENFENQIGNLKINKIEEFQLLKNKIKKLKSLFGKISKYNFNTKSHKKPTIDSELGNLSLLKWKNPFEYENEPVIIDEYEIDFINKKTLEYLNIKPSDEFFNFGRLRETKTRSISFPYGGGDNITLEGSEQEKEKKNYYDDFKSLIYDLEDLLKFWGKVRKMDILPIALSNNGNSHKELIKIKLYIPKSVNIYKAKKIPKPKYLSNLREINSDPGPFFNNIRHIGNSVVQEFQYNYIYPQFIEFGVFGYEKLGQEKRKFKRIFEHYYEYTFHQDIPDYTVLECEVSTLNTKELISLPAYIFFKSNEDFIIKYKINCKNDPEQITGELFYKASS